MLVNPASFRAKVDQLQNLPAFPDILQQFNDLVKDPHVSMNQVGDLISRDQVLSMKMLKLVNSAFYGFPGRISTVTHALLLLGYDVVKGLILSASAFDVMAEKWAPLWKHSLGVSKACGLICKKLRIDNAEEISMAGLLHDIGKLVLIIMEPEAYEQVTRAAEVKNRLMAQAEQTMLGFDHTDVASWLCEKWHLPQRLSGPMSNHHKVDRGALTQVSTAVVFFADNLVKALGYGAGSAVVEPLPPQALAHLAITHDLLAEIIDVLEKEMDTLPG
jgi:putative nucleotidyltransferase with HDIG domain